MNELDLDKELPLNEQFNEVMETGDKLAIRDFLNNQNISDVAELIDTFPEHKSQILAGMSNHRAVGVFKILDINDQKQIIKELPPNKTAELLNELPADDRTAF